MLCCAKPPCGISRQGRGGEMISRRSTPQRKNELSTSAALLLRIRCKLLFILQFPFRRKPLYSGVYYTTVVRIVTLSIDYGRYWNWRWSVPRCVWRHGERERDGFLCKLCQWKKQKGMLFGFIFEMKKGKRFLGLTRLRLFSVISKIMWIFPHTGLTGVG